jgi:hypothetical protein
VGCGAADRTRRARYAGFLFTPSRINPANSTSTNVPAMSLTTAGHHVRHELVAGLNERRGHLYHGTVAGLHAVDLEANDLGVRRTNRWWDREDGPSQVCTRGD